MLITTLQLPSKLPAATASVGLYLVSGITSFLMAMAALTVYAAGKTFFWPTMLAVASDRFPRTGALAISIILLPTLYVWVARDGDKLPEPEESLEV